MKKLLLLFIFLMLATPTFAATCTWNVTYSTNWNNATNWDCGFVPNATTDVVLNNSYYGILNLDANAVILSLNMTNYNNTFNASIYNMTIANNVFVNGTLNLSSSKWYVGGNWSSIGTQNANVSTVTFNGTSMQNINNNGQAFYIVNLTNTGAKNFGNATFNSSVARALSIYSNNTNISSVNISKATQYAIYAYEIDNLMLSNSNISGNTYRAIVLNITTNSVIENNNIKSNSYYGAWIINSSNINITNNNISSNGELGILFNSVGSNSRISNNEFLLNPNEGIMCITNGCNDATINNNTFSTTVTGSMAISIDTIARLNCSNNTIIRSNYGLYLRSVTNSNFTDNKIENCSRNGIYAFVSSNNKFMRNNLKNNTVGIYYFTTSSDSFDSNNITNSSTGIASLQDSNDNNFTNSNVSFSSISDINVSDSANNVFKNITLHNLKISFQGMNYRLIKTTRTIAPPDGLINLSIYLNATNTSASSWLFLNTSYLESNIGLARNESTIKLYRHDGTDWYNITGSSVDTTKKYAYANITNFSMIAAFADQPQQTILVVFRVDSEDSIDGVVDEGWANFFKVYTIHGIKLLTTYNQTRSSVSDIMNASKRFTINDSFNNPFKISWLVYSLPMERASNIINDNVSLNPTSFYDALVSNWLSNITYYNDILEWHPHLEVWDDVDGNGNNSWNQVQLYHPFNRTYQLITEDILNRYLIDKNFWPSTFVAGFHAEDTEFSNWVGNWIPFDISNFAPLSAIPTSDPRINRYNWSLAPADYSVYHPSSSDYQLPGSMKRTIARIRACPIAVAEADKAFNRSKYYGNDTLLTCYFHTYDSATPVSTYINTSYTKLLNASNVYGLKFKFVTAREGFQQVLNYNDTTAPTLSITKAGGRLIINSSETLFQSQPYAAVKYSNGTYARLELTPGGSWYYDVSGEMQSFTMVVGGNDEAGNPATATYSFTPSCGNSVCDTELGETISTCPADCKTAQPVSGGGGTITPVQPSPTPTDPTQTSETISAPEPGTTIPIASGGTSIALAPGLTINLFGTNATLHALEKIEAARYKILLCNQSELATYEINISVDQAYFCLNYSNLTNLTAIDIFRFDGKDWKSIPTIRRNKIICGNISTTPYLIAGFSFSEDAQGASKAIARSIAIIEKERAKQNVSLAEQYLALARKAYEECKYKEAILLAQQAENILVSPRFEAGLLAFLILLAGILIAIWVWERRKHKEKATTLSQFPCL